MNRWKEGEPEARRLRSTSDEEGSGEAGGAYAVAATPSTVNRAAAAHGGSSSPGAAIPVAPPAFPSRPHKGTASAGSSASAPLWARLFSGSRLVWWLLAAVGAVAIGSIVWRRAGPAAGGIRASSYADVLSLGHSHDSGVCPQYIDPSSLNHESKKYIAVVFGTRPEAVKVASVIHALAKQAAARGDIEVVPIASGQHASLLETAMAALGIVPSVTMSLMTPNQELTALGARLMEHVGCALTQLKPSLVIVQGDTITATMAALAAFMQSIPVAHVEAGLRTYLPRDPFPEEVQRTAISALTTLHFAPTQYSAEILLASGVCASKIQVVGNTVVDALMALLRNGAPSEAEELIKKLGMPTVDVAALLAGMTNGHPESEGALASSAGGEAPVWVIVTMHRRENFGDPVDQMISGVKRLTVHFPRLRFIIPVHPNPNVKGKITNGFAGMKTVHVIEPQPYDIFVHLLAASQAVLTDSGGLQEEGIALGKRMWVMRQATERPEALRSGLVNLVGANADAIVVGLGAWAADAAGPGVAWPPQLKGGEAPAQLPPAPGALRPSSRLVFGDGRAGTRIAKASIELVTTIGASPKALRDFQSCQHDTYNPVSLAAPRGPTDHVIHDFNWHDGLRSFLAGHQRFFHRIECSAQPPSDLTHAWTYNEIMAMPSTYAPKAPGYDPAKWDVTVIVSVYRRPQFFQRWLDAVAAQTHKPKAVWVTIFGSTHEQTFRDMTKAYDPEGKIFKFIAGDVNFKYFGRFALAMMAKTPFVALFDDDCIPGSLVLQNALHQMHVPGGLSLIGMKGHGHVAEDPDTHDLPLYSNHWEYRPASTVPVDLTGGMWFLRTDWVRAMWRDRPVPIDGDPWATGEDFQLTYGMRKYLHLPTHLLAVDQNDANTWPHSNDYFQISSSGDSTNGDMLTKRKIIHHEMILKGYTPARTDTIWGEAHKKTNVLVVVSSAGAAAALEPLFASAKALFGNDMRLMPVVAADPRQPAAETARVDFLKTLGYPYTPGEHKIGFFDLSLATRGVADWRSADVTSEVEVGFAGVLETARPAAVLVFHNESDASVLGVEMAAAEMKVPVLGYAPEFDTCAEKDIELDPDAGAAFKFCMPQHPVAQSRGLVNFVTNSPVMLLKHLLDTLCTCTKGTSRDPAGGAYATCPDVTTTTVISDFTGNRR